MKEVVKDRGVARTAWRHMAPLLKNEKLLVARLLLTAIGNALGTMGIMLMIREFLSATLNEDRGLNAWLSAQLGQEGALFASAGALLGAYFLVNALFFDNQVTAERIRKVIELGILSKLVRHIIDLSVPYVSQHSQGDLMEAIRTDIRGLREVILGCVGIFVQGMLCISLGVAAFILSPYLFLWGFVILPVAVVPIIALSRRIRARSYSIRSASVGVFDFVLQVINGIRLVVTYGGNKNPFIAVEETATPFYDENIRLARAHALSKVLLEAMGGVSVVVIILVGGFQVMGGELGWPALLAFVMTIRG
ncbi:MAG: ABC transporter transmembrane domain-containing protein, partial [Myxococcota bacterium]